MLRPLLTLAVLAMLACVPSIGAADDSRLRLATTTSTENSGLLDHLIPMFTEKTGIEIDVVAVGTGQALEIGRRGDAEALLTHDRDGEDQFVADGFGTDRRDVMYNDFVIVGPRNDPAKLAEAKTTNDALSRIATGEYSFTSRGDDSGTHRRELRLWKDADLDVSDFGSWYRETGAGMGETLLVAVETESYTLTDRGTWISFQRKGEFQIAFEQHPPLNNPYSSILVTSTVLTDMQKARALAWHEWLTSDEGRAAIAGFKVEGQQLFFVD